jgi:hexosaminidase
VRNLVRPAAVRALLLAWLLSSAGTAEAADARVQVIPEPGQVGVLGTARITVTKHTPVLFRSDAEAQVARYFAELVQKSGGPMLDVQAIGEVMPAHSISLRIREHDGAPPEGYEVSVTPKGVLVEASDARGLFYGMITLWQLCTALPARPDGVTLPALVIKDAPRFPWRGLMLDSARHFQSPEFILRYIDWMALHKLNTLSWHLTDDQGWRLQIKRYPRLTEVGAWRVPAGRAAQQDLDPATGRPRLYGGFYTQEDVRRIVAHAAARHVTIVPEIDLPGHMTAAIVAYPQLAARPDPPREVPADWGIYPNVLNAEDATLRFLENVLDEVMALFPGEYIHIGGDEVVTQQWHDSPEVQARIRALGLRDESQLPGYFTTRLGNYLRQHGRRAVGWDEVLASGLPADEVVVMSWRGVEGARRAAAAGRYTVLSPDPVLYLDHRQGGTAAEPPGRGSLLTVEDIYRFDPLPGELAAEASYVLGVQANLWTEHVRTEERAAYMTYPRAAALAEVAWSPAARLDWADFRERLRAQFARYAELGVPYSSDVFAATRTLGPFERHMSQDLRTCTDKVVLSLEDDAPRAGTRAVFLVDIMNPCWILPAVDLAGGATLTAAVGQVPYNFQLGKDLAGVTVDQAAAPGELVVRTDGCSGAPLVSLSLAPAVSQDAVIVLPAVQLPARPGRHDLCLRFAQPGIDPLWVIDWLEVSR